jgi:anaerobic C4-dicarboxylate transporter
MGIAILCVVMILISILVFLFLCYAIFRAGKELDKDEIYEREEKYDEQDKNY